jgi:hypothetical protein
LATREPLRKAARRAKISRWPELNWQPTDYKSVALPLSYIGKDEKTFLSFTFYEVKETER